MSSRHANRSRRPDRDRGSGRPRGGFGDSEGGPLSYGPVPTIRQVVVGAPVSIVLKVDQPTGFQVQGIVADLLTRGDHPRGIKVRLEDGRVGRVQKMVSKEEAMTSSAGLSGLGRNGETSTAQTGVNTATAESIAFSRSRYSDFRNDETEEPEREISLADYVVKDKRKNKGAKPNDPANVDQVYQEFEQMEAIQGTNATSKSSPTVTCPVCGEFEGDEVAVAHHVDSHFA